MAGPNGGEAPRELPADGGVSDAVRAAMAGLAEGGASDGDVEGNVIVSEPEPAALDAFRREYGQDRSWEAVREDGQGRFMMASDKGVVAVLDDLGGPEDVSLAQRAARAATAAAPSPSTSVRRGVIRSLVALVDLSAAAAAADMRPTRAACAASSLARLATVFFDSNPLSHMAVVVTRGGTAERLTALSGAPASHAAALRAALDCRGAASLQNGLDLAVSMLRAAPPYSLREVLVFFCGLTTCDPGDIGATLAAAKAARVRVSVICLAADVHVCRRLAEGTGGTCTVALDEGHLSDLALAHAPPPPLRPAEAAACLVRMGFPRRLATDARGAAFVGREAALAAGGFACPRCAALSPDLPAACHVCGLALVAAPSLARSYHHLFPLPVFDERGGGGGGRGGGAAGLAKPEGGAPLPPDPRPPAATPLDAILGGEDRCYGCLKQLSGIGPGQGRGSGAARPANGGGREVVLACPKCGAAFCFACDTLIHSDLFVCPGCEAAGPGAAAPRAPWVA